eukprot:GGOE01063336.1.p1 GENE.GGOE01063336.1~~GGOE01063336.1.p1  ORF type:complete len:694 (-),score=197.72 GGOE01063336.1:908-2803(-)
MAALRPRIRPSLAIFLPPLITPTALMLLTAAGMQFSRFCRKHVLHLAVALCLMAVAICGWLLPQLVHLDVLNSHDVLEEVFPLLEGHPTALSTLEKYIKEGTTAQDFWPAMFYFYSYFQLLHFFAYTKLFHMVYFSMPLMVLLTSYLNPLVAMNTYHTFGGAVVVAGCASATTVYIELLRRQNFRADYDCQQSLLKEAQALQDLACQEMRHKKSAHEADSVLNHSLKNMMADAVGCIHMHCSTLDGAPPAQLALALTCLERGMGWCRKRQALLELVTGGYVPMLTATRLPELGHLLVHDQDVTCSFVDATVLLDPVLCDLVLDNGISNAFQHGHPEAPAVHFTITLASSPGGPQLLTLEVANRVHPDRAVLGPQFLERILGGEEPKEGAHFGLRHMFMAAQAHGMALTLEQNADWVVLRGILEVTAVPEPRRESAQPEACLSLPPDTHIFCVDDSDIARRLLAHTFGLLPDPPVVHTFGATALDVEAFLAEAPNSADIVILDQNLDYGAVHYQGTELLRQLVSDGFTGLICIRSANVHPDNQHTFIEAGAHCAIGKDVSPKVLVNTVLHAFAQHSAELLSHVPLSLDNAAVLLHSRPSQDFTPILMMRDILPGSVSSSPKGPTSPADEAMP